MRHFCMFHLVFDIATRMLIFCVVACVVSSCTDDTFDKYQQGKLLSFTVNVPENWTNGSVRAAADISINKLSESDGLQPLYLVTEISEVAVDKVVSDVVTRGMPVESISDFYKSFGLSAICYTGEWPAETEENQWTTNFAHNLKVSNIGGNWASEKKLDWTGSGNIKFFAYSPHADTEEFKGSIIHSGPSEKGAPVLTYTVPEDITRQPDLMTATTNCKGNQGGDVALTFSHALTAITIKTGKDMLAGEITEVSLSGVYGKGGYSFETGVWTIVKDEKTTGFSITKKVELPGEEKRNDIYTPSGTSVVDGELTFMMIPQTLPKEAKLIIHFTDSLTMKSRTLTASLGGKTWPKGKKVIYSISSTGIVMTPVVDLKINRDGVWVNGQEPETAQQNAYLPVSGYLHDVEIAASMQVTQEGEDTETLELPYKIQYKIEGGGWMDKADSWIPENASKATSVSPGSFIKGAIRLPAQKVFDDLRAKLNTNETNGSKTDYYDLVANNPLEQESANCYIVDKPGYYKFPACYGNTYPNGGTEAYKYEGSVPDKSTEEYLLMEFVGHDDNPIQPQGIPNIHDAVLVWQDSPDLVTDIKYNEEGWVYFCVPEAAFNQGNAVIAVRNDKGEILWSWHIWATYYGSKESQISEAVNEYNKHFYFLPCNLGYCDPHGGNSERKTYIRFVATMPDGTKRTVTKFNKLEGAPTPDAEGIFTFVQPEIIESIAGDNPYYQWGRKDPMLPGVYNATIRANAPIGSDHLSVDKYKEELDMENKVFYSTEAYRFTASESGRSIGESIRTPHHFFMHKRPTDATAEDDNYLRRHWHNGESRPGRVTSYKKKTIMNFWNSQLDENAIEAKADDPNNRYVFKTIYDPSPAGYKVPPPAAFSKFTDKLGNHDAIGTVEGGGGYIIEPKSGEGGITIGWYVTDKGGHRFFFPATGLRDMGISDREVSYGTWPAHSKLTFIASSGFKKSDASSSCLLFSLDYRVAFIQKPIGAIYGTNNAYGFTLRPILDKQK